MTYIETDESTLLSQDDLKFISIMEENIHTNTDGSYETPLPFRLRPQLPNNRSQAEKRLLGLKRKMEANSKFKLDYYSFMNELMKKGHAEPVNSQPKPGEVWYIPHFAVTPKKG